MDVDWYVEDDQPKYRMVVDQEKAALNGISKTISRAAMQVASAGYPAGLLHGKRRRKTFPLTVRLDRAARSDVERIQNLKVAGRSGRLVALQRIGDASKTSTRTRASTTRT